MHLIYSKEIKLALPTLKLVILRAGREHTQV